MDPTLPSGQGSGAPLSEPRVLILVGGGEHAAVVVDAAHSLPELWHVAGYVNAGPTPKMEALGLPWLGDDPARCPAESWLIVATGSAGVSTRRSDLVARFAAARVCGWATVIHARAWVAPTAVIQPGTLVCAQAVVNSGAVVGQHCIVNSGAIVEHDVTLGDFVQVAPAVALGGGVSVGAGSFLGLGCRVRDHVRLGERVTVGMGAVVIGSVADGDLVVGVPARPLGHHP
jgi:acetyltransferase EpsM